MLERRYEKLTSEEVAHALEHEMKQIKNGFVAAGYYMKQMRDNEYYKDYGYETIWDFAEDRYGIKKATASRWMAINDKFSKDGNSPILAVEYQEFERSQLQEMLYLEDSQLKRVTADMTVKEIREIRKPEVKLKKPDETQRQYLKDFARYLILCKQKWFLEKFQERVQDVTTCPTEIKGELGQNSRTWYFRTEIGAAKINLFDDYVQLWDEKNKYIGNFEWFYLAAAIQNMWNVIAIEKIEEQTKEIESVAISQQKQCIHRPEHICNVVETQKAAAADGAKCSQGCCWYCKERKSCGYACRASSKNPLTNTESIATSQQDTSAEESSCPPNQSSCPRQNWGSSKEDQEVGRQECKKCWDHYKKLHRTLETTEQIQAEQNQIECVETESAEEQFPNQMNVYDYPELIPEDMQQSKEENIEVECQEIQEEQKRTTTILTYLVEAVLEEYDIEAILLNVSEEDRNDSLYDSLFGESVEFTFCNTEMLGEFLSGIEIYNRRTGSILSESYTWQQFFDEFEYITLKNEEVNTESDEVELEESIRTDLEILRKMLEEEKRMLKDIMECYTDQDIFARKQKIKVGALASMLSDLEEIEVPKLEEITEQPELPVLRNNEQRKAFLENYQIWPVWFEVPEASEVYHRYDLPDGSSIVTCEYFMYSAWRERYGENPVTTCRREYLLKPGYKYFHDCETNTTALVEHLKNVQKGGK